MGKKAKKRKKRNKAKRKQKLKAPMTTGTADSDGRQRNFSQFLDDVLPSLSYEELRLLNERTVQQLRLMQHMRATYEMKYFSVGDRVVFEYNSRQILGTVIRLNRKTISVHDQHHHDWRVSPWLLRKMSG